MDWIIKIWNSRFIVTPTSLGGHGAPCVCHTPYTKMNAKIATPSCSLRILLRNFSRVASFVASVLMPDEAGNLALRAAT
jgi:hypothetical protein